ncbi:MBL fold metallo-hydrolase [Methyloglobulus sp.]|uniref:MBL fold metallo-hydrolase n=1 Tax=Methyloglobulus sp. TaxID=2518622 RepID=UPI003989DB6F
MKQLHRKDLFSWSEFNPERNLDFHSVLWVRADGNVLIDPLPLSAHDQNHLRQLGGAQFIIVTNSDHCRDAFHIAKVTGAVVYGPAGERDSFPLICEHWLHDNQEIVPGLVAYQLNGSKTPGELALVLDQSTLITGDLIRSHVGGELSILPEAKLTDAVQAKQSVKRMASLHGIKTVLVGDGWPLFNQGGEALKALASLL